MENTLLLGKRIVVIGGAGLLGRKICKAVLDYGASCIIADISLEASQRLKSELTPVYGSRVHALQVSIIEKASILKMVSDSVDILGDIDILINTAYPRNKNYGRKFEDVEYIDFCENMNLHLGGYFLVSQTILEYFKSKNGGNLINMSSIYGVIPPRFDVYNDTTMTMPVEYAAVKSALVHMTKYMARYYKGNNIRVNCISLGGLLDKQADSFIAAYNDYCLNKGMLDPEDILGTVVFLASGLSQYINGQNIIVDDGFTL